jgi:hypothetical protein
MNTIEQNNALIAEFMGFDANYALGNGFREARRPEDDECVDLDRNTYLNWNELMPVVEKIESTYLKLHGYFGVYISSNSCSIQGTNFNTLNPELNVYFSDCHEDTKLKSTYEAVVNFIKWHQDQK